MQAEPARARAPAWRHAVRAAFRHQLRLLLYSRLTLVFQIGFLLTLPVFVFLIGDFFAADQASLDLMLAFLPWVALIFVPALAMRAFADRPLDREREFLLTLPVPPSAIAVGAWLAGAVVMIVTLLFTTPFVATLAFLGKPDLGAAAAGYLGAACLLLAFYAIGLFASALARSEIGAFVLALAMLFVLLMFGWDGVGRLAPGGFATRPFEVLAFASPKFWLDGLATGEVQLRALGYFAMLTAAAVIGVAAALRMGGDRRPARVARLAAVSVVFGAAVVAATAAIPARFALDFTEARRFTLSRGLLEIVSRLPENARIDLYWSAQGPEIPEAIRAYAAKVRDFLDLVASRSGGRLSVAVHDPAPGAPAEAAAEAASLRRMPLSSGDAFFLGASFAAGGRRIPIAYFDQNREALLEYDVATALAGLTRTAAPKVGVISPLLAPGGADASQVGLSAVAELRRAYDVAVIPAFADRLPDGLDCVVVIGATFLKKEMLRSIDEAVGRGAGLIVMIDPRLRLNPKSDAATPQPSREIDDISDLLLRYGLRYRGDDVVGDASLATPVADASGRTITFPFWMRFTKDRLSAANPVTAGLGDLLFVEPGAFEAPDSAALVSTTAAAGAAPRAEMAEKTPAALAAAFSPSGGRRIIAAEADGPFPSAFDGGADRPQDAASAVFAVADIDWILDPFAYEPAPDPSAPRKPRNDNAALFLNMVERASGGGALIATRSRAGERRPLTRVAALARSVSEADQAVIAAASTRVAEVERRIAALPEAAGVRSFSDLPPDVQQKAADLRRALASDRAALRAFQDRERAALQTLRARVILFNLLAGPLLALAWTGGVALLRRSRRVPVRAPAAGQ